MSEMSRIVGRRLREARIARGRTGVDLAKAVEITPGALSQYERELSSPRPRTMAALAFELQLPISYFTKPFDRVESETPLMFRSLAAATKGARGRAELLMLWYSDVIDAVETWVDFPKPDLPDLGLPEPRQITFKDVEDAAAELRRAWGLGLGPVPNTVHLLESKGCFVGKLPVDEAVDAFSSHDKRPMVLLNAARGSLCRERFDVLHELFHLLAHRDVKKAEAMDPVLHQKLESDAHHFAGAVLFPRDAFETEVYGLNVQTLLEVKRRWKISMQAIIRRAFDLKMISRGQYEWAFRGLSMQGYRKSEPLDDQLPTERPRMLANGIHLAIDQGVLTRQELLHRIPLSPSDIEKLAGLEPGYLVMDSDAWDVPLRVKAAVPDTEEVY